MCITCHSQVGSSFVTIILQTPRIEHRITSVCPLDNQLWVGTGSASVHIFSVSSRVADPEDSIMQLAQYSKEDPVSKSLCAYVHPSDQEGLVGGEIERELPSPTQIPDRSFTEHHRQQYPYRFHRKNAFGRTFHREIRREMSIEKRKEQEVYQLSHVTSSEVLLAEPSDSPRVIGICPIRFVLYTQKVFLTNQCRLPSCHQLISGQRGVNLW